MYFRLLAASFLTILFVSCAITRPCQEGGDVSWPTKFVGDQTCFQVKDEEGEPVNHGEYRHYNEDKKIMLEGMFVMGKKHGLWIERNVDGQKVLEKKYENGAEVSTRRFSPDRKAR